MMMRAVNACAASGGKERPAGQSGPPGMQQPVLRTLALVRFRTSLYEECQNRASSWTIRSACNAGPRSSLMPLSGSLSLVHTAFWLAQLLLRLQH
eukprot:1158176-Pelagomonas_calceolata.AAC.1